MSYSDPQSVTINAVATSLPRVFVEGSTSKYASADGLTALSISHSRTSRKRSVVRIDMTKTVTDPMNPGRNLNVSQSAYAVLQAPTNGTFSAAEQGYIVTALADWLKASAGANVTKFVAGES